MLTALLLTACTASPDTNPSSAANSAQLPTNIPILPTESPHSTPETQPTKYELTIAGTYDFRYVQSVLDSFGRHVESSDGTLYPGTALTQLAFGVENSTLAPDYPIDISQVPDGHAIFLMDQHGSYYLAGVRRIGNYLMLVAPGTSGDGTTPPAPKGDGLQNAFQMYGLTNAEIAAIAGVDQSE